MSNDQVLKKIMEEFEKVNSEHTKMTKSFVFVNSQHEDMISAFKKVEKEHERMNKDLDEIKSLLKSILNK